MTDWILFFLFYFPNPSLLIWYAVPRHLKLNEKQNKCVLSCITYIPVLHVAIWPTKKKKQKKRRKWQKKIKLYLNLNVHRKRNLFFFFYFQSMTFITLVVEKQSFLKSNIIFSYWPSMNLSMGPDWFGNYLLTSRKVSISNYPSPSFYLFQKGKRMMFEMDLRLR